MRLKSPSKQKCNLDWLVATAELDGRTSAKSRRWRRRAKGDVPAPLLGRQLEFRCPFPLVTSRRTFPGSLGLAPEQPPSQ